MRRYGALSVTLLVSAAYALVALHPSTGRARVSEASPLQDEVTIHLPLAFRGAQLGDFPTVGTAAPTTAAPTSTASATEPATPQATDTPTLAPSEPVPTDTASATPSSTDGTPLPETPQSTPTVDPTLAGILGYVSHNGRPDVKLTVRLSRLEGSRWVQFATAATNADGLYFFPDVPDLPNGSEYGVSYANVTSMDDHRLSLWFGPRIQAYSAGEMARGGDFDTANVMLVSPDPGGTVSLPAAFEWESRGIEGDSYQWLLSDPDGDDSWGTEPLGDDTSYTVRSFTPPVAYDKTYRWHVRVHNGGGYGLSFYEQDVSFEAPSHGIAGTITFRGTPSEGVPLQLLRLQGNNWAQLGTTTTDAGGAYDFDRAPTLPQNAQYHVQYENLDDPERLSLWLGPAITLYGAGEAADGGSFDIADIGLNAPAYGATETLPVTFEWGRRGVTHDDYEWFALDAGSGQTWTSDRVGDDGAYELSRLKPGMQYGTQYWWYVRVHREGNGVGVSFMQFPVTFDRSAAVAPQDRMR